MEALRRWLKGERSNPAPLAAEPSQPGTVTDPVNILLALGDLCKQRTLLSVRFRGIRDAYVSSLLSIDKARQCLLLDELNPTGGHKLLERGQRFTVSAVLRGVELSFPVDDYRIVDDRGVPGYRVAIPRAIHYPQRRQGFRHPVPESLAVSMSAISPPTREPVRGTVANISRGGIAVCLEAADIAVGQRLQDCRLALGDGSTAEFDLDVRYARNFSGKSRTLIGAAFLNLAESESLKIERFIVSLERNSLRERANGPVAGRRA